MNLEDLERLQAANVRPVITSTMTMLAPYQQVQLSNSMWYQLLRALFEIVQPAAARSAEISRDHYDAERSRAGLPPHPIPLSVINFDRFVRDMEEVRPRIQSGESTQQDIHRAALRVARSVENSGRWTVMKATEWPDPAFPDQELEVDEISLSELREQRQRSRGRNTVKGWARVATGRETCGWCWMLVSRGPVYRSAETAGSRLTDRDALQTVGAQEFDTAEHMNAWHDGCDCKVVPVFDLDNWDGRDRYLAAEQLWKEATKGRHGKDAIKAYRRAVEAGGIQEVLSRPAAAAA